MRVYIHVSSLPITFQQQCTFTPGDEKFEQLRQLDSGESELTQLSSNTSADCIEPEGGGHPDAGATYEQCIPLSNDVHTMSLPHHTRHQGTTLPLPTPSQSSSDVGSYAAPLSDRSPLSPTRLYSPLSPPRPSHLANTQNRRSWSAADTSIHPPLDAECAPTPPTHAVSPLSYACAHSSASKYTSVESDATPAMPTISQMSTAPYLRDNGTPPPNGTP